MDSIKTRIKKNVLRLMGYKAPLTLQAAELAQEQWEFVRPVWVLSTGRCGTLWLTELLRASSQLHVNHSDYPELIRQGALAYQDYHANPEMYQEILRAARDGYLAQTAALGQRYVETNNRITFFAYAIQAVYPRSRFIHLVRHPGDFVRSGLRRGWYQGAAHDEGRIQRVDDLNGWERMSDMEKIAWLWNETNQYIETFLAQQPEETKLFIKAEEMFNSESKVNEILTFIDVEDIGQTAVRKMLSRRANVQRKRPEIPAYDEWSASEKEQVRRYTPLASRYGYTI